MVELSNGETVRVTHIGTLTLSSKLILKNVLCVPSFSFNLLLISMITKLQACYLVLISSYCFIQDLINWQTIGVRHVLEGLFLLQCSNLSQALPSLFDFISTHYLGSFSAFSSISLVSNSLFALWHSKLGHPSDSILHSLSHFLPASQNSLIIIVLFALYPFPQIIMSHCSFDLVHMDVWGPFSTSTMEGFKYFLTIVDDATRATWIFLMKSKSEVRPLIISFYIMVNTQFRTKIKFTRFDNALEIKLFDFYASNGIVHQQSCVYTPQ